MGICLATTSGKGGTGKSTVCAALAVAFANSGKSVLLIDMDEGLRCLDMLFGVDDRVVFDLADVLCGKPISDAAYTAPVNPLISIIPAPINTGRIEKSALQSFSKTVKSQYDTVIFDFPAGMDFSLYSAIGSDVRFLTVCNPDPVSVRDAAAICNAFEEFEIQPRLIINRFNAEYIKRKIYSNIDDIIDISGFRLLGIIPQSTELMLLPVNHSISLKCRGFKAADRIAHRLCGDDIKLPKIKKI